MKHGRLPWPTRAELDEERAALYDRIAGGPRAAGPQAFPLTDADGRLNGPFNAMLQSPHVGTVLQELGAALRYRSDFTAREREIAILEVSALRRCEFEWYAHDRVGERAGLTADERLALRTGAEAPSFDARETLVRIVARACIVDRTLADALYLEAETQLGTPRVTDLIVLCGYYDLLALMMNAFRTPLPAGEKPVFTELSQG